MKKNSLSDDLRQLLKVQDELCISLIVPMNELPSMRKLDKIALDHAISKLEKLLENGYDKKQGGRSDAAKP